MLSIQMGMAYISNKAFKGAPDSSCAENISLKFMHDVIMPITAMHTWPGCYDVGQLVVKY